jgi:hypothetical protein
MIKFEGVLYAAIATEAGAFVGVSKDDGLTWRNESLVPAIPKQYYSRSYGFIVVGGKLYVSTAAPEGAKIFVLDNGVFKLVSAEGFFAGLNDSRTPVVRGYTPFREHAVYIAHEFVQRKARPRTALFAASNSQNAQRFVHLPDGIPRAVASERGRLFALWTRVEDGATINHVFETSDLASWLEAFRFRTPTFARSMELMDRSFYFGLGSDRNDFKPGTGEIMRLKNLTKH